MVPVIVTWPETVDEMEGNLRLTPLELNPVPQEVPLTVSEPELVVMMAPDALMP